MKKIISNQNFKLILPAVFSIPFLLIFGFLRQDIFGAILFLVGLYLGQIFYLADEKWLYDFYADKQMVKTTVGKKLITRSMLFMLILIPLTIFVLTSSGSMIGMGLVLGIHLAIIEEIWRTLNLGKTMQKQAQNQGNFQFTSPAFFQSRLFYDLKTPLTQASIDKIFYAWMILLVLSSLLALL